MPGAPLGSSPAMRTSASCCGLRDRQRAQADRVEQLKDRGVRADAERQRQNRDEPRSQG